MKLEVDRDWFERMTRNSIDDARRCADRFAVRPGENVSPTDRWWREETVSFLRARADDMEERLEAKEHHPDKAPRASATPRRSDT